MVNTQKLKAAMVEIGYTQESLANKLGMSKNTLNAKINGKSKMFVDEACAICEVLHISTNDEKVAIFLSA